jgi:uroporphyrinogen-III decarboxylase
MLLSSGTGKQSEKPENWSQLTPEQKRQWKFDNFLKAEGINFVSPEAREVYHVRAKRTVDAYNLKEPDKVPISLPVGNLPFSLNDVSQRTAMYDYQQAVQACQKFNEIYSKELEYYASPFVTAARVLDILDYKLYSWPGHGLPLEAPSVQFMENEYMKAEEYDDLIDDPSDFWFRTYLPRVFGAFESFRLFSPMTAMVEVVSIGQLGVLAAPPVQETLMKMTEVGREYQRMMQVMGPYAGLGPANGFPMALGGAFAKAPFDTLGDTLRGTAAVMKDLYRRPEKVLAACDKIADLTIKSILRSPGITRGVMVMYPLHKGADGWMSQKQFETFYFPSLKKVMDAFINEGLVQYLFAEGSFNTRLDYFSGFPKGSVTWLFDQSDMFRAKKLLGDRCCIQGNIPSSLMVTGSPQDVKEYCRKLIEGCGKGGGYVLAAGAIAENPKLENLRAIIAAVNEYGVYRK